MNSRKLEDDEDFSYLNELIASPSEAEDDNLEESLQKPSKKKVMFISNFILWCNPVFGT